MSPLSDCWPVGCVGNRLTTSGNHLRSFALVENPIHALVWLFEGKAITVSPGEPSDCCQVFSGLDVLVLTAHFECLPFTSIEGGREGRRVSDKDKDEVA